MVAYIFYHGAIVLEKINGETFKVNSQRVKSYLESVEEIKTMEAWTHEEV